MRLRFVEGLDNQTTNPRLAVQHVTLSKDRGSLVSREPKNFRFLVVPPGKRDWPIIAN